MRTNIFSITKIKKRDSRVVSFNQEKITNAIHKAFLASKEENGKEAQKISDNVIKIIEERFKSKIPMVEDVQDIIVEALKASNYEHVAGVYTIYREKRKEIREARYFLILHNMRIKITPNAVKVLESRYLKKDNEGKIIETPTQLFQRVAHNIAAAEKFYHPNISDDDLFKTEEKFFKMIASLEFLPNSPTLMNAGAPLQQLSACFVLPIEDSMEGIFETLKNTALIHQSGGGTGFSFSRLRAKGDYVRSTHGVASGPISFASIFDKATEIIKQGGKRRGANMGILRVDHPDILEFISCKDKDGFMSNFNISVALTDEFMKAVEKKKKYKLLNPRNNQTIDELDAAEVFDKIVAHTWVSGDPGVIFIDRINEDRNNPTPKLGKIESTNPCGEQPLLPYESCNLGSINLDKMLKKNKKGYGIDWDKLKNTTRDAVHFLDNVIEMNNYPLPQIAELTKGNRKIGLGVMGFADMLIRLETPYASQEALDLADKIMKFINEEGHKMSEELAEKRGVFSNWYDSYYSRIGKKRRNATITTIAPTGTIGIIAGSSQGIEPIFALAYIRKSYIGKDSEKFVELIETYPLFEEIAKQEGFYSQKLMRKVATTGSVQGLKEVPKKWQKIFITAHDISPKDHIKIQSAFQKHVDNAVSKTINFPHDTTVADVKGAYQTAYKLGCKGITIYRDGSKSMQILNVGIKKDKKKDLMKVSERMEKIEKQPELIDPSPQVPDVVPGVCLTCN